MMFLLAKKLAFNIFFAIKLCKSLRLGVGDIGPAYLMAPIKTSRLSSCIGSVFRKVN